MSSARIAEEVASFVDLVATLRKECPWDRAQTHRSLTRHLLEETYEVLDAIEALPPGAGATGDGDSDSDSDSTGGPAEGVSPEQVDAAYAHLEEELGDLLFQVAFHSTLAAEEGRFDMADVARNVNDKLRSRHPHVFGDVEAHDAAQVVNNWEQIKKHEKGRASVFDGIPQHLPSLLYALKVQSKAANLTGNQAGAGATATAPGPDLASAAAAAEADPRDETLAQLLYAAVEVARANGIDPETALRAETTRRREQAMQLEEPKGHLEEPEGQLEEPKD